MAHIEILGEGIAAINRQLFSRCKARKTATCELSGKAIQVGDLVYRPMGNPMNRYVRYLAAAIEPNHTQENVNGR